MTATIGKMKECITDKVNLEGKGLVGVIRCEVPNFGYLKVEIYGDIIAKFICQIREESFS